MLDARYRIRRGTVPPAVSIVRCQASLRDTSAIAWSSTVATITQAVTLDSAVVNSSPRPASSQASTVAVVSEPTTVSRVR